MEGNNKRARKGGCGLGIMEAAAQSPRLHGLLEQVATGEQAHAIYRIGEHYASADETLERLGYLPNRRSGERGMPLRLVA